MTIGKRMFGQFIFSVVLLSTLALVLYAPSGESYRDWKLGKWLEWLIPERLLSILPQVLCQTSTDDTTAISSNAYCFRFTWLGPDFDSSVDITGATCTDILNTYTDTPCTRPLVATSECNPIMSIDVHVVTILKCWLTFSADNGYLPDTAKLWEQYKDSPTDIACRLTAGNVCVKYVHRYNNQCRWRVQSVAHIRYELTLDLLCCRSKHHLHMLQGDNSGRGPHHFRLLRTKGRWIRGGGVCVSQ